MFSSLIYAAPAPFPKEERDLCCEDFYGSWKYHYSNNEGFFVFYKDGKFDNVLSGIHYTGSWTVSNNVLTILEKAVYINEQNGTMNYSNEQKYNFKFCKTKLKIGKIKNHCGLSSYCDYGYTVEIKLEK